MLCLCYVQLKLIRPWRLKTGTNQLNKQTLGKDPGTVDHGWYGYGETMKMKIYCMKV